MTRSHWHGWAWAGFLAGMIGTSFLGCYGSLKSQQGSCEDDGNPCTVDTCDANGTSIHAPVSNADMTQCFLGENEGVCQDGSCELHCVESSTPCSCVSDNECPPDKPCVDYSCNAGQCVTALVSDGMVVDPLEPGDCRTRVCQDGNQITVADTIDTPVDNLGDCKMASCNGDTPTTIPNLTDPPAPTECIVYNCIADGTIVPANAPVGATCSSGACDNLGMCVACLPKVDYDKCKMNNGGTCPVPKCEGQPCTSNAECVNECADGVCCNTTCTDECKSCAVPGMVGTCTNIPSYQVDNSYGMGLVCTPAMSGSVCDGAGKCLRTINTTCMSDAQCFSGKCTNLKCLGAPGEICNGNAQCISMMCVTGTCK